MREILEELKRQADIEIMKVAPQAQRKYKKVPTSTRKQFLNLVHKKKMSIKKAAESLGINYSSAKTILAQHRSSAGGASSNDQETSISKSEQEESSNETTQVNSPESEGAKRDQQQTSSQGPQQQQQQQQQQQSISTTNNNNYPVNCTQNVPYQQNFPFYMQTPNQLNAQQAQYVWNFQLYQAQLQMLGQFMQQQSNNFPIPALNQQRIAAPFQHQSEPLTTTALQFPLRKMTASENNFQQSCDSNQ